MALGEYLAAEIALDCADGLFSRREAVRRLMLLGLTAPAAAALLASCGDDDDGAFDPATTTSASSGAAPATVPNETATVPTAPASSPVTDLWPWCGPRAARSGNRRCPSGRSSDD